MTKKEKIQDLKRMKKLLNQTKKFIKINDEDKREKLVKEKLIKVENIIKKIVTKNSYISFF